MRPTAHLIAALGLVLAAAPALAEELRTSPKAVLELFTSQGCSSCPPADALLDRLSERPDVVALAYHVDYWDYIGWADTFGSPAHTALQQAYAQAFGAPGIYTPQLVVNGQTDLVGSRAGAVEAALADARLDVPVSLRLQGDTLAIDIAAMPGAEQAAVWLVTFIEGRDVAIEKGENGGRAIHYAQVVTERRMLGLWEPETGTHMMLPLAQVLGEHGTGAVVLIQNESDGLPGPIVGAASIAL